jgi:hypothetical protein
LIGSVIALIGLPREKGKVEEAVGFSGDRGGAGRVEQRGGRRKEGGKGRLTGGSRLSAPRVKEKEKGGKVVGWRGNWAGPPGPQGANAGFCFFFFSFFKLHFQIIFQLKFKSNFFKLFSRIL